MSLGKNTLTLNEEKNLAREYDRMQNIEEESANIQRLADYYNNDELEMTPSIISACENLADAFCSKCNGYGYLEYEDSDDFRTYLVIEICECIEKKIAPSLEEYGR
tara:strand:+ start:328 stop:645 length:318 start_codon:yes stop_codon:yes gene_type:complete